MMKILIVSLLICSAMTEFTSVNEIEGSDAFILEIQEKFNNIDNYFNNVKQNSFLGETLSVDKIERLLTESNVRLDIFSDIIGDAPNSCKNREKSGGIADFYYFAPNLKALVKPEANKVTFETDCFKKGSFEIVAINETSVDLVLELTESTSLTCSEIFLITTARIQEPTQVFFSGKHKYTLKNLTNNDISDLKVNGVRLLGFCQGIVKSLESIYMTAKLYLGGFSTKHPHVTDYMEKSNIEFLKNFVGFDLKHRAEAVSKSILNIDKKDIKTGDFVAITRLDGLDQLIDMGTGSSIGHTAIAAWIDGDLYVLESQDGWYWPRHGIQRNQWDQWVQWAHAADFHVEIVPLKEEFRQLLNAEDAINWFKSKEGLNYGYHNFLFGWLDTRKNLPSFMDFEIFLPMFAIWNKVNNASFDKMLCQALNHRMGTKGLNYYEVVALAAEKGIAFEDLVGIVEKQGWEYDDGENYVCSAFCTGFYKAGGLFPGMEINATEFGPKDVYQLEIFDQAPTRPQICIDADPNGHYCQVMGKYGLQYKGLGTIKRYSNMNERCNSQSPDYIRNDGC